MSTHLSRRGFLRGTLGAGAAAALLSERARAEEAGVDPSLESGAGQVLLRTTVNGIPHALEVGADETALSLVRERLGLTGAKESCGHGACGACALHLDGTPVAACLLPATALEGHQVTTIEGLGPVLHPVQRAFMAEDALQCGFCTPGFVMEAVAFHDRWRRANPAGEPTRDEVADALAGHLCRCGAYPNLYAAVVAACAGRHDQEDPEPARVDAREKVTGKAIYTVDVSPPGKLEGRILRSPHANATVRSIDLAAAAALPGVGAVVAIVAAGARVRFVGQEIAAVAAVDRATAEAALARIQVEYEVRAPVVGIAAALAPGAPLVYDPPTNDLPLHFEGISFPLRWDGNRRGPLDMSMFSRPAVAQAAMEDSNNTVARLRFTLPAQAHTALEPHACVASWKDGALHVWMSTQGCSDMAADLAERYDLPRERVVLRCDYVGGAFGAKYSLSPETVAAIDLARAAGAPVRMVNDRLEEMTVGGYRPGMETDLSLAASPSGELAGIVLVSHGDGGVSAGSTNGFMLRLIYPDAPKSLLDYDVLSHAPAGRPFRAPGGPQALFALEQTVDEIAVRRGEDPIAVRRRWDPSVIRAMLYDAAAAHPLWADRGGTDQGRFRRGVGLAAGTWYYLYNPATQVRLDLADGKLTASCAAQDIGNGTRTVIAAVVAEVLGIPRSQVGVRVGDARDVVAVGSSGSRTTASVGPAAADAAAQLRLELLAWAARGMGLVRPVATVNGIGHAGGTVRWVDALASAPPMSFVGRRRADSESLAIPSLGGAKLGKRLPGVVQLTEVEVDTRLGRVRPVKVWVGLGAGRMRVPRLARSQVEGAVIQALGYALYEERRLDPKTGRVLTAGLEDYRLPGIGDTPPIEVHFEERGFEHANGGGIGMSELATIAGAASVANAVRQATGWRPRELPIRPDRVLAGVAR